MRALVLALALTPASWAAENSCVSCHRHAEMPFRAQHNFQTWRDSAHGRAGVTCEACHGGDPMAAEKTAAHAGVYPTSSENSRTHFLQIPRTCGKCHKEELAAFKTSEHYKRLTTLASGPTCVTCHDSMATTVATANHMERLCTLCHKRPTMAFEARESMLDAEKAVRGLAGTMFEWKKDPYRRGRMDTEYREIAMMMGEIPAAWHAFDMPLVIDKSEAVQKRAQAAKIVPPRPVAQ